jgi:hypothetical protein
MIYAQTRIIDGLEVDFAYDQFMTYMQCSGQTCFRYSRSKVCPSKNDLKAASAFVQRIKKQAQ